MKNRLTEEQVTGFLREAEADVAVNDLYRRHGFSEASYYQWWSMFGRTSVSETGACASCRSRTRAARRCWPGRCFRTRSSTTCCEKSGGRAAGVLPPYLPSLAPGLQGSPRDAIGH